MSDTFAEEYEKLEKLLYGFLPDEDEQFLIQLDGLINKYGQESAVNYALGTENAVFYLELFVKSGLRTLDKSVFTDFIASQKEDEVYSAALSMAICGYDEGFAILEEFATSTHLLSKNIDPITDVLPDLKFVEDLRGRRLETLCGR